MDIGGSLTKIAYYSTVPLKQIVYGSQVPADDTSDELQVELSISFSPLSLFVFLSISLSFVSSIVYTHISISCARNFWWLWMDLTSNVDSKFRIFPNISKFGQFDFNPVSIFGQIVTLFQDLTLFHSKVTKSFGHSRQILFYLNNQRR